MLTAHRESFREGLAELAPVLPRHYEELSLHKFHDHPLAPQFDVYFQREDAGQLMYITIRANGELAGYYIGFIAPGLHYKSCLTAHADIFYVVPEFRGGGGGDVLFNAVEKEIRRRGCSLWQAGEKIHLSQYTSALFRRHGLEPAETIYHKWLEK